MSIWVGVRVRPFNKAQQVYGKSQLCASMKGNLIRLELPGNPNKANQFQFDGCFWSHDGFKTNNLGYYEPITEEFADQKKISDVIGTKMLNLSFEGIDTSFIAYGQVGAGKSYSTFGLPENVGIVQNFGKELLKHIQEKESENVKYSVGMSMFEIYLEQIEDLLASKEKKKEYVQIKSNKDKGINLQNLSVRPIHDQQDLCKNLEKGCQNKNIHTNFMNTFTSRGHNFVYFYLTKRETIDGIQNETMTFVQFIDLAGSERIYSPGVTQKILKEIKQANRSMLAFKNVINALSSEKGFVSYRQSKLTRLLQESLQGVTKTFVLCPISPAHDSYQQSLQTLRIGTLIRKIKKRTKKCLQIKKETENQPKQKEQSLISKKVQQK